MSLAAERFLDEPDAPVSAADAFLDAPDNAPVSAADAFLDAPTPEEAERQNIVIRTIGNIGNAAKPPRHGTFPREARRKQGNRTPVCHAAGSSVARVYDGDE
jgi:hypothetical protein